jgi:hypothetical protein
MPVAAIVVVTAMIHTASHIVAAEQFLPMLIS